MYNIYIYLIIVRGNINIVCPLLVIFTCRMNQKNFHVKLSYRKSSEFSSLSIIFHLWIVIYHRITPNIFGTLEI